MSYCRFSSDNWRSDVYVYESEDGYEVHVAANRIVGDIPQLPEWEHTDEAVARYFAAHKAQMAFVSSAARADIGGKFDGDSYTLPTLEALRDKLRELEAAGYHVPGYVFETIEEEMETP